jgi:hypothetical protein
MFKKALLIANLAMVGCMPAKCRNENPETGDALILDMVDSGDQLLSSVDSGRSPYDVGTMDASWRVQGDALVDDISMPFMPPRLFDAALPLDAGLADALGFPDVESFPDSGWGDDGGEGESCAISCRAEATLMDNDGYLQCVAVGGGCPERGSCLDHVEIPCEELCNDCFRFFREAVYIDCLSRHCGGG